MIRITLVVVFLTFVVQSDVVAQVVDEHKKVGCFTLTARTCSDMAFNAQPRQPWAQCTIAICKEDELLEILKCSHPKGLDVTDGERVYADVTQVAWNEVGRSQSTYSTSEHICGQVWTCSCNDRAVNQTCKWPTGGEGEDYKPIVYWTTGPIDCDGIGP